MLIFLMFIIESALIFVVVVVHIEDGIYEVAKVTAWNIFGLAIINLVKANQYPAEKQTILLNPW